MPSLNVQTHLGYMQSVKAPDAEFVARLVDRRRRLAQQIALVQDKTAAWQLRSYPVLAVHAPVMTTQEGKIEYPGDPMCLYSALSLAVDQAVKSKRFALTHADPYNDVCPRWGDLPSREYRRQASDSGIRDYAGPALNTDQTVYAPGIWNEEVKRHFVENVLKVLQPRVVLISAVSPGHRYALDIARTVRHHLPNALIALGGRHADETMRYHDSTGQLDAAHSSTLRVIADGRAEPVIDFVQSGDGYFSLDLLIKAISIAMDMVHMPFVPTSPSFRRTMARLGAQLTL